MQKKETAIEVKVGALVLFALALLVSFVLVLGDFTVGNTFSFNIEFDNAGGLKPGADVAIAGINVGNVQSLRFIQREGGGPMDNVVAVRASIAVENKYADAIREDSEYFITTRGVLVEPYIEIVTEDFEAPPIEEGAVVRGVDPPRMDIIVAKASELMSALTDLLSDPEIQTKDLIANTASLMKNIDSFVVDNRDDLDQTMDNVRDGSGEASKLLTALNVAVDDGEGLKRTITNAERTAANANSITTKLDRDIDPILDNVSATAENARQVGESANRLIVENEPKIARTIDNVETSSDNLVAMSKDANSMVSSIRSGEGTVGALLNDREIYDDLKETLRNIKQRPWKIVWKE